MKRLLIILPILALCINGFSQPYGAATSTVKLTTPLIRLPNSIVAPSPMDNYLYPLGTHLYWRGVRLDTTYAHVDTTKQPFMYANGLVDQRDTTKPVIIRGGFYHKPGSGDVNGSGGITALDALFVKMHVEGSLTLTDAQKARADYDGDGRITMGDALWIQYKAAAQGTDFDRRLAIGSTLYPIFGNKVILGGKYRNYSLTYGYDVEANGSLRIPLSEKLILGGITASNSADSIIELYRLAQRMAYLSSALKLGIISNSMSDTVIVDSSGILKKRVGFATYQWSVDQFGTKVNTSTLTAGYYTMTASDARYQLAGEPHIWSEVAGTRVSTSSFSFSGTQAIAYAANKSIFKALSVNGDSLHVGYIKSVGYSNGLITCTVVSRTRLHTGAKNFNIAYGEKIWGLENNYRWTNYVPTTINGDAVNPIGKWYPNVPDTMYVTSTQPDCLTPASGGTPDATYNLYDNTTAIYGAAISMGTNTTLVDQVPATPYKIWPGHNVFIRWTSSTGTTLCADCTIKVTWIPASLIWSK